MDTELKSCEALVGKKKGRCVYLKREGAYGDEDKGTSFSSSYVFDYSEMTQFPVG